MWQWPVTFIEVYLPRLIEMGRIDQTFADKVRADLAGAGENPNALMITPLVVEIVAEKIWSQAARWIEQKEAAASFVIPSGARDLSCAQAIIQERKRLTAGQILRRLARLSMTPLCAIAPDKLAEMKLRIVFRRLSFYTLHKSRITIHSLP
jgi:hypothetical protein